MKRVGIISACIALYRRVRETAFLNSIPGLVEGVREAAGANDDAFVNVDEVEFITEPDGMEKS